MTYIALLRGINVGGHRKIAMADLRALFADLGYGVVRTYVQSGNVVFEADAGADHGAAIRTAVAERFGHEVPTVVLTAAAFARAAAADPFAGRTDVDASRRFITFLHPRPDLTVLPEDLPIGSDESAALVDGHVYLCLPSGAADTKLNIGWFERRLGVTATSRNMKTVKALCDLAGA